MTHIIYRGHTAEWDGEQVYIRPIVAGGVGWWEYAATWTAAMRTLRVAVLSGVMAGQ